MSLSKLAMKIAESPTLALNSKARSLREQGKPVIHLGAGEPKTKVPASAILSAAAKLTTGEIRYTPTKGIPTLINAIIKYTEKNYKKTVAPANVVVSAGAKQAIYNLMMTLLNPGEEVIMLAPYWVSYPEIIKMLYGVPVTVMPPQGSFEPTIEGIKAKVSEKTKAIIVNSPNNPSGVMYSAKLIQEIVEYCEDKGIYVIMDDIYHKLIFDNKTWPSPFAYANDDFESSYLIVVNGVSKLYAMTGFRIGWTIASTKVCKVMINVAAQNTSCPSPVQQEAAVGALNGNQSNVENLRLTLENNRNIMINELKTIPNLKITVPDGTFYCLPDFSAYNKNSNELSQFLLEKALVVSVPGGEFGLEGHLRLSYCGSVKDIMDGVARIKWALDPDSPKEIYIGDRKIIRDWK
ncbi:MAG: pyridoxal phosphate-dependent aminotransferase [candidate division Zixibacteria bacterium]|nr:pyridoxal phosphate-dependent aminotransferase [candidate division Zixibacteria bacterium]